MNEEVNFIIPGASEKPIVADLLLPNKDQNSSIIIFCHGYKGFKDWGPWDLVAKEFVKQGFGFLKFNFSHNGGTVDQPIDFPDLDAFGRNTYTRELNDLGNVIDWVMENKQLNADNIYLIGHSRGGGIVLLKAAEDERVRKVTTWAAVADFGERFPKGKDLQEWKDKGVHYIMNGRTGQQMPHYFEFYEDYLQNKDRLDIPSAVKKMKQPLLIIHGSKDEAVAYEAAEKIHEYNPLSLIKIIEGAGHTFRGKHPYDHHELPADLTTAVETTIEFFKN